MNNIKKNTEISPKLFSLS